MGTQWYTGSMSSLLWVTCGIARRVCGSRTTGSWFNLGTPLVTLLLGIMTHYSVVDGSEEERSVIVHNRLTFQVSGRVRRLGKNGCGLWKHVASGVGVQRVMCRHSLIPFLAGPLGGLPRPQRQGSKPVHPNGVMENFFLVE